MKSSFGSRLKEFRTLKQITQEELGNKIGVQKQAISRYESGDRSPNIKIAAKFAETLGVSLLWLIGEDVPMKQDKPLPPEENNLSKIKQDVIDKVLSLKDEDVQLLLQIAEKILQAEE